MMLGTSIKDYLRENGVKQSFLKEKLNISASSCNAMLNGNRNISAEEYFRICDVLGLELDYFKSKKEEVFKYGEARKI